MDKFLSALLSLLISTSLFYGLLSLLFIKPPIDFDYENFVEIQIDEESFEFQEDAKDTQATEEQDDIAQEEETEEVVKEESKEEIVDAPKKRSVEDLFGNTANVEDVKKELKSYEFKTRKVDGKKATLDLEKLFKDEKKLVVSNKQSVQSIGSNDSEERKYLKILHKRLLTSWRTKPEDAGKSAQIYFSIAKDGTFVYYFKRSNLNGDFYRRLQSSLELLKATKLPEPKEPMKVTVNFIAKE